MGIRRSYHFNANQANRGDGVYVSNQCDFHFRTVSAYSESPYGLDSDSTSYFSLGDRLGYKPNSFSLPVDLIGGVHGYTRIVSGNTNVGIDDYFIQCDTTGGNINVTIPAISTMPRKIIVIENIGPFSGSSLVQILATGPDTIDGSAQVNLDPSGKIILFLDPTAGAARVISNTVRFKVLCKSFSPSTYTTTSGSYATLLSAGAQHFSGRPGIMTLHVACFDNNATDEFWSAQFGVRIAAGADIDIVKTSGFFYDLVEGNSGSIYFKPGVTGLQTVDIRWKRTVGAGTIKIDSTCQIILNFLEF